MKKFFINAFIIIALIGIFLFTVYEENVEKSIPEIEDLEEQKVSETISQEEVVQETQYQKEEIESYYNGYEIMAKLEIPAISLETYILADYSEEALKVSPTKFWGVDANQIGNFCVVGHNL